MRSLLLAMAVAGCGAASAPAAEDDVFHRAAEQSSSYTRPDVHVTAVPDVTAIAPGQDFTIGVRFVVPGGRRLYWKGATTDAEGVDLATKIVVSLPDGFSTVGPQWPGPTQVESVGDSYDIGYDDDFMVSFPIAAPEELPGDSKIEINVRSMSCTGERENRCHRKDHRLQVVLPNATSTRPSTPTNHETFARHVKSLPRPLQSRYDWFRTKGGYELRVYIDGATEARFFPSPDGGAAVSGQAFVANLGVGALHINVIDEGRARTSGVIYATDGLETHYFELNLDAPTGQCEVGEICHPQ